MSAMILSPRRWPSHIKWVYPDLMPPKIQDPVEPHIIERERRPLANHRLRVISDADPGLGHELQVVGPVTRGDDLILLDPELLLHFE